MLIHVKVIADSKKDEVLKKSDTSFDIYVREPREGNRANVRMIEVLSLYIKKPKNKIRIITGHHQPSKIIEILD
ncbi:MAG: DUF167 domain-containing protein [Candidatus Taylorbacteria bacterium]|nr:DUF167 domain-containing protein [Candidatus Taylorbacteria bacterium]